MLINLRFVRVLFIVGLSFFSLIANAQNASLAQTDMSQIKVDMLSDEQVASFVKKAEESGMSEQQLVSAAMQRGMPSTEVDKLRKRIEKLKKDKGSKSDNTKFRDRTRMNTTSDENAAGNRDQLFEGKTEQEIEDSIEMAQANEEENLFGTIGKKKYKKTVRPEDKVFGLAIFKNKKLSFEPSLNIATPQNYVLGADDEVVIDIWGASQETYQEKISPEGNININGIGPIHLNGLTIEAASVKLRRELSNIYAGLRTGNTSIKISLGSVRSIKVNILGDVTNPGTYTLPSLATVFNALYSAGGPSLNGTLRSVRLVRANKTIADLDFYDYLLKGEQKDNMCLQDQDVIFISPYSNRVEVKGEAKRPFLYDVKDSESLKDLVNFAGGFTGKAYSQRMKVIRKNGRENKVLDVATTNADTFKLVNGDEIAIDSVLNRFENRVEIKGAVYRAGVFSVDNGVTLKQLIDKADGLRGDAFKNRATIYRTKDDLTMEAIPVDLAGIITSTASDITLMREDIVWIPSIFDIKEEYSIKIDGEVRYPGSYPFVDNSNVEDVILRCGGLMESASFARLEVARRVKNIMAESASDKIAEIFQFPISADLKLSPEASKFVLLPFDQIFIRRAPGYENQTMIKVQGEVAFPGNYIISSKTEKISDIIKRAGGLTSYAYPKGSRIVRKLPIDKRSRDEAIKVFKKQSKQDDDAKTSKDSVQIDIPLNDETTIGIELNKILANPGSPYDLLLQKGDSIIIPRELQTVRINGGVLFPITVRYDKSYRLRSYVSRAGGFSTEARVGKSYVLYANGSVKRTHKLLFIKFFPRIDPGAEIIVPQKPVKKGFSTGEIASLVTTFLSSLALVTVTIINFKK